MHTNHRFCCVISNLQGNHGDTYKQLDDPRSWPCPWAISDVIPQLTKLGCAKLCTEQLYCMMFVIDGTSCILTKDVIDSTSAYKENAQ